MSGSTPTTLASLGPDATQIRAADLARICCVSRRTAEGWRQGRLIRPAAAEAIQRFLAESHGEAE